MLLFSFVSMDQLLSIFNKWAWYYYRMLKLTGWFHSHLKGLKGLMFGDIGSIYNKCLTSKHVSDNENLFCDGVLISKGNILHIQACCLCTLLKMYIDKSLCVSDKFGLWYSWRTRCESLIMLKNYFLSVALYSYTLHI